MEAIVVTSKTVSFVEFSVICPYCARVNKHGGSPYEDVKQWRSCHKCSTSYFLIYKKSEDEYLLKTKKVSFEKIPIKN